MEYNGIENICKLKGDIMANYYDREDLEKFQGGDLGQLGEEHWDNFMKYYGNVMAEGKLPARTKALIALAVAHAGKCPYCIEAYTTNCLDLGITKEEMMEAVHVASAMEAGMTLVTSVQMKNLIDDMEF